VSIEPYVSHEPNRRDCWKGHGNKDGVRRAINYARAHNRNLRVFAVGEEDGWVTYTEIPAAQWDTYFAESEA
jgi:hypothetical protein